MISPDDIRNTLARCAAYDPSHFPKPSEAIAEAWYEHMTQYRGLTAEDLRNGVREYYNQPSRDVPKPADISVIARKFSRERYEESAQDSPLRLAHEALGHAKACSVCEAGLECPDHGGVADRRRAIESFAQRFGIGRAEAEARMERSQGTRNELDAKAIEVAHRRMSTPAPIPCPDCGRTEVPCPCDIAEEAAGYDDRALPR